MKKPDREQQKKLVAQWKKTGEELNRIRRESLRNKPYNWKEVDALLQLGENIPPRKDNGKGLIEMQRYFSKAFQEKSR